MILVQVTAKLQDATTNRTLLELQETTTGYHCSRRILLQLQNTTTAAGYYYK